MKAGRNIWGHCNLNDVIFPNEEEKFVEKLWS